METKHTKGKWQLQKDNSILSLGFENVLIAQVCSANNNDEEKESNAKLIASAPEMFEILTELQSYFKSLDDYNDAEIMLSYKIKQLLTKITE